MMTMATMALYHQNDNH